MEENRLNIKNLAFTENGALSYASTLNVFADQFGLAGNYRGRKINDVFKDQEALWEENKLYAIKFLFYLRLITRKTKLNDDTVTSSVQKGQGCRDEAFKRLLWFAKNQPDVFYKNIILLPIVGSWKDLWQLMVLDEDLKLNCIDRKKIYSIIGYGLQIKVHQDLIKKFMPRIISNTKCLTTWKQLTNKYAKEFAKLNNLDFKSYNKLKSSGNAHTFQKLICARRYGEIDWNMIPGKALLLLSSGKFITNHDLQDDVIEWVNGKSSVNFNGYPYELLNSYRANPNNIVTNAIVDKQFNELIRKANENGGIFGNVLCALDTSGSMTGMVAGNISAYDICISLGIYFSTLNKGSFHKYVAMFDDTSTMLGLEGGFCDMAKKIIKTRTAWGGTNFQSLIDMIVDTRKMYPNIPLEDYCSTILVVSDMEFNATGSISTNYEEMKRKLYEVFPEDFVDNMRFIWWNVASRNKQFPGEVGVGMQFFSGFDGSIMSLILGGEAKKLEEEKGRPLTTEEMIDLALSQEIFNYVTL